MNYKEKRKRALADARAIADVAKAAGRDLTDGEVAQIDAKVAEVEELDKKLETVRKSDESLERLASWGTGNGLAPFDDDGTEWPTLDETATPLFASKSAGEMVARRLMSARGPSGEKAVPTSIPQSVPLFVDPEPVKDGGRYDTIFDVIAARPAEAPAWTYRRATTRELNAQMVGTGELKPTSVLEFEEVTNRLGVIATLAGPLSEQTLQDYGALVRFVQDELLLGIRLRLEDEVFSGTGEDITATDEPEKKVGQHFAGLLNTTGVLDQAFTGDGLGTIATAATRLEADGFTLSGVAMHPNDWVSLVTSRNASGGFDLGGAVDPATKSAWGYPVRLTRGLPEGKAMAVSYGSVAIRPSAEGLDVRAVTIDDDAARNQVRIRAEGRFGLDIYRPGGLCAITLSEDGSDA